MATLSNQRVAWFNGRFVPEREVLIPFRDRSFTHGDGVFDIARTFGGKPFRLKEHVDRLYRSLRYTGIDAGMDAETMTELSLETLARNAHLLDPDTDYWIGQRVTRGGGPVGDEGWEHTGGHVIIECQPLPLAKRAELFATGLDLVVPGVRRTPPESLSPRAKMHNYLNHTMAELAVQAVAPKAWPLMLDTQGNIAEGTSNNFFLVRDGALLTPRERMVLPGVSRQAAMDLAGSLGIEVIETDIDLFDAYNADEAFITATSLCICPVRSIDGRVIGTPGPDAPFGPVTKRLVDAWRELVGFDFVAQFLKHRN